MSPRGLRISGGELRGRMVSIPPGVRPTGGKVREALFAIWGPRLPGSRFLDLFAGSGAVGLEAASRGAREVVLVEADPRALRFLARSRQALGLGRVRVVGLDIPAGLPRSPASLGGPFDLAFADPPYRFAAYGELLAALVPLLGPAGEAAIEHSSRRSIPGRSGALGRIDERRYGESRLSFYRLEGAGTGLE